MPQLSLWLFGGFRVETDSGNLLRLPTDKVRGLLTYLALESDQPHRREHLAALLWSEQESGTSLHNLRQSLYRLGKVLGKTWGNA